jgi:hypothetical protein
LKDVAFDDGVRDLIFGGADALDWFLIGKHDVLLDKNDPRGERKTKVH